MMLIIMVTFNNDVNNNDQHLIMMLIIMVTFNNDVNNNGNI